MNRKKYLGFLLSSVLLLTAAVGGTLAFVAVKTLSVENQFESAYVTCEVIVGEDNNADAIKVKNTSNVDAYIRAAIVVNWMDSAGNVLGTAPVESTDGINGDYTLSVNTKTDTGNVVWIKDEKTGFYYYAYNDEKVQPGEYTKHLITYPAVVLTKNVPDGYTLSIEVIAEAIQADGVTDDDGKPAYQDAWGITPLSN